LFGNLSNPEYGHSIVQISVQPYTRRCRDM
jgi:hypothetical protein